MVYNKNLAVELYMSASEITESLNLSQQVGLLDPSKTIVMVAAFINYCFMACVTCIQPNLELW